MSTRGISPAVAAVVTIIGIAGHTTGMSGHDAGIRKIRLKILAGHDHRNRWSQSSEYAKVTLPTMSSHMRGKWLSGETFMSSDKKAIVLLSERGDTTRLLV